MTRDPNGDDRRDDAGTVRAPTGPDGLATTYDRIAVEFAESRHHPWPEVTAFLDDRSGEVGVDLGCGNGRHVESLAAHVDRVVALDVSSVLLRIARERANERGDDAAFVAGDAGRPPLADESVDLAVYIATLHHLRPRARRVRSITELGRLLTPDGRGLVSAWSTAHDRFDRETGFDTTIDWTTDDDEQVPRYYHVYDPAEFRADLERAGVRVIDTRVSSGNCYGVVAPPE